MDVKIDKKLNLNVFLDTLVDQIGEEVAKSTMTFAQRRVSVDKGDLKDSIDLLAIAPGNYEVFAQTLYAAAQEWGLAPFGKPNYRYQPYMRPAAAEAGSNRSIAQSTRTATRTAVIRGTI